MYYHLSSTFNTNYLMSIIRNVFKYYNHFSYHMATVTITEYVWAGQKFGIKIKTHCQDCDLTSARIRSMIEKEFKEEDVVFETKPWLDNFFYCLFRLCWHAPIIMVNGKKFYQFHSQQPLFDKTKLAEQVKKELNK